MSVVLSVTEDYNARRGHVTRSVRTYVRVFKVHLQPEGTGLADPGDDYIAATANAGQPDGVPVRGSSHPTDNSAYAESIDPAAVQDAPCHWIVTVNYTTPGGRSPNEAAEQIVLPQEREPEISWSSYEEQVPLERDYNVDGEGRRPVLNSAGDPFDPPILEDRSILVLMYTANVDTYNEQAFAAFANAVNSNSFLGRDPGYVKVKPPRADFIQEGPMLGGTGQYWRVSLEFHFAPPAGDGWNVPVLDQGFQAFGNYAGTQVIKDETGTPYSTPQLLNGIGQKANTPGGPQGPQYLPFVRYPLKDFTGLVGLIPGGIIIP